MPFLSITLLLKGDCQLLLQLKQKSTFISALNIALLFLPEASIGNQRFYILFNTILQIY